ncbi:zinc finger protein-like 1 homolog [Uloborus diversus]|uniref:zinc finger protein-like 1 homolog n=1 Tax=Uloborus diversus TaxID=327109 RepID=UPI002409B2C2|nr:zinc finger protein-like 1 homolog [Uloborus diversus]
MGLCKCSKKKVTNQFCFEHRVNVCEHCMVSNHSKCVVQSYLQWLQDSDYDPNCHLCKTELAEGDCIRLTCYHVFHWECINKYANSLPSQTPSSGYACPICNVCIFPQPNAVSPVTDALKNALLRVNWAKIGLDHPTTENSVAKENPSSNNVQLTPVRAKSALEFNSENKNLPVNSTAVPSRSELNSPRPEPYGASYPSSYTSPRKLYDATEHGHFRPTMVDHDEDKYKRRSALELLSRWFRSRTFQPKQQHHKRDAFREKRVMFKKMTIILGLFLIGLITLCIFLLKYGRASADSDPLLDPRFNPNIRVEDVEEIHSVGNLEPKLIDKSSLNGKVNDLLPA